LGRREIKKTTEEEERESQPKRKDFPKHFLKTRTREKTKKFHVKKEKCPS